MDFRALGRNNHDEVAALFRSVFTSSEGEKEGALIGDLASKLCLAMDDEEIICFGAHQNGALVGAIFFTRLRNGQDIRIYMLAPVAVSTLHQGKRIGQALIKFGLNALKGRAVSVVVTYGDPNFYAKVGFEALSETVIPAPLELSMPIGWLGQSLTEGPIPTFKERPKCVAAFNDPAYW